MSLKRLAIEVILKVNEQPGKNVEKLNRPLKCDSNFFCTHTYAHIHTDTDNDHFTQSALCTQGKYGTSAV